MLCGQLVEQRVSQEMVEIIYHHLFLSFSIQGVSFRPRPFRLVEHRNPDVGPANPHHLLLGVADECPEGGEPGLT